MSEVAGRLAVQEGAYYLGRRTAGAACCSRGVPGVRAGERGDPRRRQRRAQRASGWPSGWAADVSILDVNLDRLRYVDDIYRGHVVTLVSNRVNIDEQVAARRPRGRRRARRRRPRADAGPARRWCRR